MAKVLMFGPLIGALVPLLEEEMQTIGVAKRKISGFMLFSLLVLTIPLMASAQAGKAEEGQKLFDQNCAKCHGPDGSGNTAIGKAVGAKDLRSPEAQKLTDVQIATQIEQGKGNMPPFGSSINKAQVSDLIAYIHVLTRKSTGTKKPS